MGRVARTADLSVRDSEMTQAVNNTFETSLRQLLDRIEIGIYD